MRFRIFLGSSLNIDKYLIDSMDKLGIWGIAIAAAFMIGMLSANPVVEAVGGWKAAFDDLQQQINEIELLPGPPGETGPQGPAAPSNVYEVSDTITILEGDTTGGIITLECFEGDWLDSTSVNFVTVPDVFEEGKVRLNDKNARFILDPVSAASTGESLSKRIGYSVEPELFGTDAPIGGIDVTVTIVCLNPQVLNPDFLNP